jgi:hypothetical protein
MTLFFINNSEKEKIGSAKTVDKAFDKIIDFLEEADEFATALQIAEKESAVEIHYGNSEKFFEITGTKDELEKFIR